MLTTESGGAQNACHHTCPESEPMSTPEVSTTAASANVTEEGLQRKLSQRQLTMIAIGGAIGVGLFLGSSVTLQLAGPGVIISYIFGAVIAVIIAYVLAEMAVVHPQAGSFGIYADTYLNRWAGFSVRAVYGFIQIIAIGAEVTAVAIYLAYWFPQVPQWVWLVVTSTGLILINALQVGRFGEVEYWFALIKVVAILAFIGIGGALMLGWPGRPGLGIENLVQHGGFMPRGIKGVWLALTLAITSYMGIEVIAVTAGEASDPARSIPRAMRSIVFRLIFFYVFAITIMLAIAPWNQSGGGTINGSPFVKVFAAAGIPFAASIMNMVVVTAALSSANTDLYLSTRMLLSLSRSNYLPKTLSSVSRNGVPLKALLLSSSGMWAAVLLAIYAPESAFLVLYGIAVTGMFFVWVVILLTHLKFRKALGHERVANLPIRIPLHPVGTILGIVVIPLIAINCFFIDGLRSSVVSFSVLLAVFSLFYARAKKAIIT